MDWMDICTLAKLKGDLSSENPSDWWDDSKIDLWTQWEDLDEKTVKAARSILLTSALVIEVTSP
jgi:hypothetical protein